MPAGLVRDQVVEVKIPNPTGAGLASYGSGYLITPSLVLTAAHVVEGFQSADVAFSARQPDNPPRIPADVAWTGRNCDIALLRVRWPDGNPPWQVTLARLGDVPMTSSEVPFEGFGFPQRKDQDLAAGGHLRDGDRVPGLILAQRNLKTGKLDLQLTADPAGEYGAWKGFSGSAVFAYGFLVGVVTDAEADTPALVARRIAVPAGACWALHPSSSEPGDSVAAFRALLAEDGHDLRVSPARRRPDYAQTVEDLRPRGGLLGREADLAELRAFVHPVGADGGPAYADWVAEAWAGKTALAAQFASDPPPGADVISFFVSRSRAAQSAEFWTAACDQLAALVNEPPRLDPDDAAFRTLWKRAAQDAELNGRTLVLLLDGLDENNKPPPIAGAIPEDGDRTRRIIVFRREEPELELPDGHPMADPRSCLRMPLTASSHAETRRREAVSTLRTFLAGEPAGVLGVLAAAGPISARDIAEVRRTEDTALTMDADLLAADRIGPVLDDAVGRGLVWPLADDPNRFAFQHDMLRQLTADKLTGGAIAAHRHAIKRWAAGYAARNWPPETPSYLLVGYPALLADLADAAGLAALASPARAARLRSSTGDDAATVDELASAVRLLAKDWAEGAPGTESLAAACGLAFRREQLLDALTRYPMPLIEAHAALGHWQRAERIAAHQGWPAARVAGLTAVAGAAAGACETRRADELFVAAVHALSAIGDRNLRFGQRRALAAAAAASRRLVDPRIVTGAFADPFECAYALLDFAGSYSSAGLIDYAEQFMTETCGPAGPLARSAAAADEAVAAAKAISDGGQGQHGQPGNTFTDVATRQATVQRKFIIIRAISTAVQNLVRAAATAGRLDTAVRVAAILPQDPGLLALLGEACRTVTDAFEERQLTRLFGDARAAADGLPDPVRRAAALTIIAGAASGQLADDAAVAAKIAVAGIADPAQQAQVHDIAAAAAAAGRPAPELITAARATLTAVADPAQLAPALTILAQAAAAAGQTTDDLIASAREAATAVQDLSLRALTLGTAAQAAAVAAQLPVIRLAAGGDSGAEVLRWLAHLSHAAPGDVSLAGIALDTIMSEARRAERLRRHVTGIATDQLAGVRSIAAALADPAKRAGIWAALSQAAEAQPAAGLAAAARHTAEKIPDPGQQSSILGALARGFAAAGQLATARSIADGLPDPGQQARLYGAIARESAAARQPAAPLLTMARNIGMKVEDPDRRAWVLEAITEAAAVAGEPGVGRTIAALLTDPAQQARAFGLTARAAADAGQPTDALIIAARDAARRIGHPAQRAGALAQTARDAAATARSGLAARLVTEAEQAALADDPVLRAAFLAAIAEAAAAQPARATALFGQACHAADAPDPVQRAMALAEITRFAPGRPGWSERLAAQVQEAAGLTDPAQRSSALTFLLQAADRAGDSELARSVADNMTSPGGRLSALLVLARSAAMRADQPGAEALCMAAAQLAKQSGADAPAWARAAVSNTAAFCGNLHAVRAAAGQPGIAFDELRALTEAVGDAVISTDSVEALAVADAARRTDTLSLSRIYAQSVADPTRRGYLLAAIAEAEFAAGKSDDAATTLALLPPRAALADRSARGRLLAVSVTVAEARGTEEARAELAVGLADCFSPELVNVLAALEPQAIDRLTAEIGIAATDEPTEPAITPVPLSP